MTNTLVKYEKRIIFRIDEETYKAIENYAKKNNESLSLTARMLIREGLKAKGIVIKEPWYK